MKILKPAFMSFLRLVFALICVFMCADSAQAYHPKLEEALVALDDALVHKDRPLRARVARVDSMKNRLGREHVINFDDYAQIAKMYRGLSTDSAMVYYFRALRLAQEADSTEAMGLMRVGLASQLSKASLFPHAITMLDSVNPSQLGPKARLQYYIAASDIYLDATRSHTLPYLKEMNHERAVEALDSVLAYMPESVGRRLIEAQIQYLTDKPMLALGELNEVFAKLSPDNEAYAITAALLAKFYSGNPDKKDEYLYYLTLSATSDLIRANGEAASLMNLGREFFTMGDIDRALRYLNTASEAINLSGAKVLYSGLGPTMTAMIETMKVKQKERSRRYVSVLIVFVLLLAVSIYLLFRSVRRNSRGDDDKRHLEASVSSRDVYIGQLLELCSVYVESLEEFNRLVGRKLKANQTQDLYKLAESGKVMQDSAERFFSIFDSAVLKIYPDFIADINSLLQPDKQVTLTADGRLTPELRIVAFMRMGVTDSARLSKFLGLSLNTVYTYRNRMKNRACSREDFEKEVMKIGLR